ncbi:hypothetical protein [Anaeromyxobacter paludicola]|uniref:Ig-like domain-containing protein n=1 Tax=Anaeromyxobacter paludicola TaxID=2918171 RepID=A0ABN6N8D1_9BACT|nr:hypothetical protein [Anaeromyxobacter paludicola]BDG09467.1 hypothetical protein AMPC_25800 [Anaeromyxobacter paludicola]
MFRNSSSFRRLALVGACSLLGLTSACDPYESADTSKPTLQLVLATDGSHPEMATSVAANATDAAGNTIVGTVNAAGTGALTLQDFSITCKDKSKHTGSATTLSQWYVQASKILDGATVVGTSTTYTAADGSFLGTTCTPASGITVSRTVGGVATDITANASVCYIPQTPDGGSYLLVYPEGATVTFDTAGKPDSFTINDMTPSASYAFTATVKDHQAQSLPINVTIVTPAMTTDVCPATP